MAGSNGVAALRRARRATTSTFEPTLSKEHDAESADGWWNLDREILAAMGNRPASPATIASRLGLSESAITSLLSMLVAEGKIRISAVQRAERTDD